MLYVMLTFLCVLELINMAAVAFPPSKESGLIIWLKVGGGSQL